MPSKRKSRASRTRQSNLRAAKHHAAIAANPPPNRRVVILENEIDAQPRKVLILDEEEIDRAPQQEDESAVSTAGCTPQPKADPPIDVALEVEVETSIVPTTNLPTVTEAEEALNVLGDLTDIE